MVQRTKIFQMLTTKSLLASVFSLELLTPYIYSQARKMFKSKLCALSGSKLLLTLYGPLFSLVLTSCASQPTTPTRSCTRCWSWQLVRAARALECSDSPIAGTVWVHLYKRSQHCPFQWTCSLHSSAFNSGRLGRESPRLPLNTLSGWEGVTGRRLTWTRDSMMWTPVLLYVYKYLAFVQKKKKKNPGTAEKGKVWASFIS